MDYELHGRLLDGARMIWSLVVLRTMSITTSWGYWKRSASPPFDLKTPLSRMGDADAYDQDLEAALNLFMNRSTRFLVPIGGGFLR